MSLSNELSCGGGSFSHPHNPHRFLQAEVLRLYFLGCTVCLAPQLFLLVYPRANVGLPGMPATASPTWSSSHCLAAHPLHPSCLSPPLLPVWMNVSSLTPWLSDFYTVWFSGSSGCFLFLICYCPFGCARRQSVSTYTSILAASLNDIYFILTWGH